MICLLTDWDIQKLTNVGAIYLAEIYEHKPQQNKWIKDTNMHELNFGARHEIWTKFVEKDSNLYGEIFLYLLLFIYDPCSLWQNKKNSKLLLHTISSNFFPGHVI